MYIQWRGGGGPWPPHPLWWSSIKVFICLVWLHHCKSLHYVMLNSNHCWECHFPLLCLNQLRDAITKYHRCKGSNNRNYFITVLEDGKPKIKVPGDFVPGESLLLSCCQPPSYSVLTLQWKRESELSVSLPLLVKTQISLTGAPLSWPHLNLITYQRSQLQISSRCGDAGGFNIRILGEHKHSWVHNTFTVGLSNHISFKKFKHLFSENFLYSLKKSWLFFSPVSDITSFLSL